MAKSNNIYMTSTLDSSPVQTAINFSDPPNSRGRMRNVFYHNDEEYGLWSCKFSADGNEVVAGGREMIFGNKLPIISHLIQSFIPP